jgi:hypothetical protein
MKPKTFTALGRTWPFTGRTCHEKARLDRIVEAEYRKQRRQNPIATMFH